MTEEKTVGFSEILTTEYEHNDPALPRIDSPSGSSTGFGRTKKSKGKFQVDVNDVIDFIFPQTLQHPLAAGRLFCYGLYGPLDEDNNMRTGPRGAHKTSVWELDQMCLQVEREDILAIYMKKRCDIGLLSIEEQESLILQADPKLKKAAGKSMLPQINKQDVYGIFAVRLHSHTLHVYFILLDHCLIIAQELSTDDEGYYSFHQVQVAIEAYREERIQNYKLVYPKITSGDARSKKKLDMMTGTQSSSARMTKNTTGKRKGKVSSSVACGTMFQFNKGQTNPDVITQVELQHKYYSILYFLMHVSDRNILPIDQ
jgi:hypothetical protein